MVKPSKDPKPAVGRIRRVGRAAARHVRLRAAGRLADRIIAEEVRPREQPGEGQRTELVRVVLPTPGPACLQRLGAALGLSGVLVVTAAAVFLGMLDAGLDSVRGPAPRSAEAGPASCDEPASWCGGAR